MINKVPPSDLETEQAVIGAILLEKDAIDVVNDILVDDDFYGKKNSLIYKAAKELYKASHPIDIKTIKNKLGEMGVLDQDLLMYLAESLQVVNSSAHISSHALIIKEKSIRRQLISLSMNIQQECYDEVTSVEDTISKLDSSVISILGSMGANDFVKIGDQKSLNEVLQQIESTMRASKQNKISGIPTGLYSLDKITGGFKPTDYIVIAARPGAGKTALIASMMKSISVDHKYPVAMMSMEMSWSQIATRIISMTSNVFLSKLRNGDIAPHELNQIIFKSNELIDAPIYIDDTPALTVTQLRSKAKNAVKKHGIKVLFVDYLQLAKDPQKNNREQEISSISSMMKTIAKENNITVVALSQLSRKVEERPSKRPQLSDLRESGSLEQDPDMVMFLYRPEYYGIFKDDQGNDLRGVGIIDIAKFRNGAIAEIGVRFTGALTKWHDDEPLTINEFNGSF